MKTSEITLIPGCEIDIRSSGGWTTIKEPEIIGEHLIRGWIKKNGGREEQVTVSIKNAREVLVQG